MEALAGRHRSQTAPQMLTAPGERRIVGNGEVEAHHPEQRVQEPFGLAQREMVDESQGHGGFDGKIRVPPLPTSPAAPAGRPGSDRFRGHPHHHIAAANEGLVVGRPIRHAVLRLIRGMNLRLHPCSVAPAETRRAGQTAPPQKVFHATTPWRVARSIPTKKSSNVWCLSSCFMCASMLCGDCTETMRRGGEGTRSVISHISWTTGRSSAVARCSHGRTRRG